MTGTATRFVRISDIGTQLPPDQAVKALAMALEELAIAQALGIVHGQERGLQIYLARGGHVRFDETGEPGLLWSDQK